MTQYCNPLLSLSLALKYLCPSFLLRCEECELMVAFNLEGVSDKVCRLGGP